jgi:hypothetical protein
MRRALLLALVAGTAATTLPARAAAAAPLTLGIDDYGPIASSNSALSKSWISRAASQGATVVRLTVGWSAVAPQALPQGFDAANPGSPFYDWGRYDQLVRAVATTHLSILLDVTSAPVWAEGPGRPSTAAPGTWEPNPQAFQAFAHAAALRYSGHFPDPLEPGHFLPRVRYWEAWNEPNLSEYLTPQWSLINGRYVAQSPTIYRQLLNSFYAGVKGVSNQNVVLAGATGPFGDLQASLDYTRARIPPVSFVRDMLCLGAVAPCGTPAHFDALDHHPFSIASPLMPAINSGDVSVADMGKLSRLLAAARRAGKIAPHGRKQLWATELIWVTKPPDPYGVPVKREGRWVEQALYLLWREGVDTVFWLEIVDDPPPPTQGLDGGLYFRNGNPKPAARAFRFPFVTVRQGTNTIRAWGRAPSSGMVLIQRWARSHWVTLKRIRVGQHSVFFVPVSLRGPGLLRAREGPLASLTWRQS